MGRTMTAWGFDDALCHIRLDDGRTLVFLGLGILPPEECSVH